MQQLSFAPVAVMWTFAMGCGAPVQAGLANAPALGGAQTVDPRVHDAISNGLDSCGRHLDPGPLRYRVPPCPSVTPSTPRVSFATAPVLDPQQHIHLHWLEHYYLGWPCPRPERVGDGEQLVAWATSDLGASQCEVP